VPIIVIIVLLGGLGILANHKKVGVVPKPYFQNKDLTSGHLRLDDQKMDLNKVSEAELNMIPRLSKKVAKAIIEKRRVLGKFKNFDEVDAIKGVGVKTKERLMEFTMIAP